MAKKKISARTNSKVEKNIPSTGRVLSNNLTQQEIDELRKEMQRDGLWMREQLRLSRTI